MLAATYKIDIIYDPQPPHPHAMIYAHTLRTRNRTMYIVDVCFAFGLAKKCL